MCSPQSCSVKQMRMDGDMPYLPPEIITNILKRLPVKSLLRFQCVCRDWKNLFKTPSFITDHLHHSINQNPLLLFRQNGISDPLYFSFLDCEMEGFVLRSEKRSANFSVSDLHSSNGLICLERDIFQPHFVPILSVWNPATRKFRTVPGTIHYFEGECLIGFGFSPYVNDYKIVRTYAEYDQVNRVDVFSLSSWSWKKEIECGNLQGIELFPGSVTAHGVMFWLGSKLDVKEIYENDDLLIVSFDIATEVFTIIPMPTLDYAASAELTVYENKLAVLSNTLIVDTKSSLINLWVMEGTDASGKRWSWFKRYTSSPYLGFLRPVTIWKNEIVCYDVGMPGFIGETEDEVVKNDPIIVLFNLTTNEFKILGMCGRVVSGLFNFTCSLVPVGDSPTEVSSSRFLTEEFYS